MRRDFSLSRCGALLLLCASLVCASLLASPALGDSSYLQPPAGLNEVYLRMHMLSLSTINGVDQTFLVDFFLLAMYAAPNPASTGLQCANVSSCDTLSSNTMHHYWQPRMEFINSASQIAALQDQPYSFAPDGHTPFEDAHTEPLPDGWIWIVSDQRYQGTFFSELHMHAFPYDIQHLDVLIQSGWSKDKVRLVYPGYEDPATQASITDSMALNIGWDFMGPSSIRTEEYYYPYNGQTFHRLALTTTWKRDATFYLSKIVAGMMLLVWMCIWNFSLQIDVSDRMMGTLQVFTGLVSFLFVASGDTPKLPYQTRLDVFMVFSFFQVGLMMFIHGILYYFREQGFQGKKELRLQKLEKQKRKEFLQARRKKDNGNGTNGTNGGTTRTLFSIPHMAEVAMRKLRSSSQPTSPTNAGETGGMDKAASPAPSNGSPVAPGAGALYMASPSGGSAVVKPSQIEMSPAGSDDNIPVKPPTRGGPRPAFTQLADVPGSVPPGNTHDAPLPSKDDDKKDDDMVKDVRVLPARMLPLRSLSDATGGHPVASPLLPTTPGGSSGLNSTSLGVLDEESDDDEQHAGWEVRLNKWSTFSLSEWFAALACTRKWDAVIVPTLFLFYTCGTAVILGRPHSDGRDA